MSSKSKFISMFVLITILCACGKANKAAEDVLDSDTVQEKSEPDKNTDELFSISAETASDLLPCNSTRESALAYVKEDKKFRSCENGDWVIIDMVNTSEENQIVNIEDEAAGINCAAGGKAIQTGFDRDADGNLNDEEVTNTDYVCNGIAGAAGKDGIDSQDGESSSLIVSNRTISGSGTDFCSFDEDKSCYLKGGQIIKYADGTIHIQASFHHLDQLHSISGQLAVSTLLGLISGAQSNSLR